MFNNLFKPAVYDASTWQGAIAAGAQQKNLQQGFDPKNPNVRLAQSGNEVVKTPAGVTDGIVPIVSASLPDSQVLEININSDGKTQETTIVIGNGSYLRVLESSTWTENPAGMVTMSTGGGGANAYPLWVDDLCYNTILLSGFVMETTPSAQDTSDGKNAAMQLTRGFQRFSGAYSGERNSKPLRLNDFVNPYQFKDNIREFRFSDSDGALGPSSCLIFTILPNVNISLRLFVAARIIGRQ